MNEKGIVRFYEANEVPFGAFSNYYVSPIVIDSLSYASMEHFYQSEKFEDKAYKELIRTASTPHQSKVLASQRLSGGTLKWRSKLDLVIEKYQHLKMRADWDQVKETVMLKGLQAKFSIRTHPRLAALLKQTGQKTIVENSPRDWYWGCGADGRGKNRLGELLMQVRSDLLNGNVNENESQMNEKENEKNEQKQGKTLTSFFPSRNQSIQKEEAHTKRQKLDPCLPSPFPDFSFSSSPSPSVPPLSVSSCASASKQE